MKNRTELAKYFAKQGFKRGAEIGVYLGHYSRILLDNIPDLHLLCVDSWNRNSVRKRAYHEVKEILSRYENVEIIKGDSVEVSKTIPDKSLDFVFIDADHYYDAVKKDIQVWSKKVKDGGILSGHDYLFGRKSVQVVEAVNEYIKENNLELFLTDYDKENPYADDRQQCWYVQL